MTYDNPVRRECPPSLTRVSAEPSDLQGPSPTMAKRSSQGTIHTFKWWVMVQISPEVDRNTKLPAYAPSTVALGNTLRRTQAPAHRHDAHTSTRLFGRRVCML